MSFHPWCLISASLLVGNFESSFSIDFNDSSPVYLVMGGNFSVSLYFLHLAASLYILTLWKLTVTLLYSFFSVFLLIPLSSSSENWYMLCSPFPKSLV